MYVSQKVLSTYLKWRSLFLLSHQWMSDFFVKISGFFDFNIPHFSDSFTFDSRLHTSTVEPFMPWGCTELSKLTSPSLWNLTVDLAARFSQTFFTRASFHRGEEVWLKSFNFQSFFALKIIILYFKTQLSAWNRSIFFLQDLSSRFELAYSALDSVKRAALVGNTVYGESEASIWRRQKIN